MSHTPRVDKVEARMQAAAEALHGGCRWERGVIPQIVLTLDEAEAVIETQRTLAWLSGAVYRLIADEYDAPLHRNMLRGTLSDHEHLIDQIVDALVEYGAVIETDGDLRVAPDVE